LKAPIWCGFSHFPLFFFPRKPSAVAKFCRPPFPFAPRRHLSARRDPSNFRNASIVWSRLKPSGAQANPTVGILGLASPVASRHLCNTRSLAKTSRYYPLHVIMSWTCVDAEHPDASGGSRVVRRIAHQLSATAFAGFRKPIQQFHFVRLEPLFHRCG